MLTIRSRTTRPGSWADRRRRVGAIPADSAAVHPQPGGELGQGDRRPQHESERRPNERLRLRRSSVTRIASVRRRIRGRGVDSPGDVFKLVNRYLVWAEAAESRLASLTCDAEVLTMLHTERH